VSLSKTLESKILKRKKRAQEVFIYAFWKSKKRAKKYHVKKKHTRHSKGEKVSFLLE